VPDRKLEDHPEDLRTLRSLLARGLGLPGDPARLTPWERVVHRWKPLQYAPWVVLALGFLFLGWMIWLGSAAKQ
jgi:hypothetical protein